AAVETETGNTHNSELHCQYIALLAARVVTGRRVNSGHFTIRKGGGVEARRFMRVLVEPEADRILWLHVRVLLGRAGGARGPMTWCPIVNCSGVSHNSKLIVLVQTARSGCRRGLQSESDVRRDRSPSRSESGDR